MSLTYVVVADVTRTIICMVTSKATPTVSWNTPCRWEEEGETSTVQNMSSHKRYVLDDNI